MEISQSTSCVGACACVEVVHTRVYLCLCLRTFAPLGKKRCLKSACVYCHNLIFTLVGEKKYMFGDWSCNITLIQEWTQPEPKLSISSYSLDWIQSEFWALDFLPLNLFHPNKLSLSRSPQDVKWTIFTFGPKGKTYRGWGWQKCACSPRLLNWTVSPWAFSSSFCNIPIDSQSDGHSSCSGGLWKS